MEEGFNLMEAADSMTESTDDVGTTEELSSESSFGESADEVEAHIDSRLEGQPKGAPKAEEAKALTPDEILAELGKQGLPQNTANPELLKMVNALAPIHNGMPIEIKDESQLRELVQKGYDYTTKTMAHAEEVRNFQKEIQETQAKFQQMETEFQEKSQDYNDSKLKLQLFGALFTELQRQDPALFEDIDARYRQHEQTYLMQRPLVAAQEEKFAQLEQKLNQFTTQGQEKALNEIRSTWEKEWGEVSAKHSAQLAKLGVHIDQKKVQEVWAADATGKMSVTQALNSVYGDAIVKAYESHKKLLTTKTKSMERNLNRTGAGSRASGSPTIKVPAGEYGSILRAASAEM